MKKTYFAIILFLFFSCSNKNDSNIILNNDTPLKKTLAIKKVELDSIRQSYEDKEIILKYNILNSVNIDSIPTLENLNYKNASAQFSEILRTGDESYFEDIMIREIFYNEDFDFLPYVLYMAETHNSSVGYYYVWLSYFTKNKRKKATPRDQWLRLDNLEDDEKSLALASLIKSAQLGYSVAVDYLSEYFREGIYMNKDVNYANKLYEARNN